MAKESLQNIEKRIRDLTSQLAELKHMRPGTLSVQYRDPAKKKKPFHQISYTHKGKSRSEYVRAENLGTISQELANYKTFKAIVDELIDLSIKASHMRSNTRKG